MVMISERPADVEDRAVPGHWEGDLILGENSRSAVGALVERSTRLTLLLHLPDGKSAEQMETTMREAVTALPSSLARTITWDQGAEIAKHAELTTKSGIPIYFCDPHSPWQRCSNKNTNGLLRQYKCESSESAPRRASSRINLWSRADLLAMVSGRAAASSRSTTWPSRRRGPLQIEPRQSDIRQQQSTTHEYLYLAGSAGQVNR